MLAVSESANDSEMIQGLVEACFGWGMDEQVATVERLTGGANMETLAFNFGEQERILRRMPEGVQDSDRGSSIPIETEAALVSFLFGQGIRVPEVIRTLSKSDGLGRGYIMPRIHGETRPKRIQLRAEFETARAIFLQEAADQLSKIHALPLHKGMPALRTEMPADALSELYARYSEFGGKSVSFELAFEWLKARIPSPTSLALVHGDYRLGNFMMTANGLAAILDWEQAHFGDPVRDLAYLCVPSWRFACYENEAAGIGQIEDWLSAYELAAGKPVERSRFDYWLVFCTLWWGVTCMEMVQRWRHGADRVLEKPVIGTRVSEVELDLILLLEELSDLDPVFMPPTDVAAINTNGGTKPFELAEALSEWLTEHIIPTADGDAKFDALVARNALGIIKRQLSLGEGYARSHGERLRGLGVSCNELHEMVSDGSLALNDTEFLRHLRMTAIEQIQIDQPGYPGLAAAIKKWSK